MGEKCHNMEEFLPTVISQLTVSNKVLVQILSIYNFVREFDCHIRLSPFLLSSFVCELFMGCQPKPFDARRRKPEIDDDTYTWIDPPPDSEEEMVEFGPIIILNELHTALLRTLLFSQARQRHLVDYPATVVLDQLTWPIILQEYLFLPPGRARFC